MMRAVAFVVMAVATAAAAEPVKPLDELRFLVGSWEAESGPTGATGSTTFRWDVQDKVLVRTNQAAYAAAGGRPASRHDDLMILYVEDSAPVRGIYFDNEGHVIRYSATSSTPEAVTLTSDPAPGQPRFRLKYSRNGADRLAGEFASTQPDKPDAFVPMFQWTLVRKTKAAGLESECHPVTALASAICRSAAS